MLLSLGPKAAPEIDLCQGIGHCLDALSLGMIGVAKGLQSEGAPARAWQRMLSGRRLDLVDPSPMDIEIEDIAHGLARVARWNGQTLGDHPFSVAQHCVLVEGLVARKTPGIAPHWRLAALLHDAAEYVIGDMISPFKTALGVDYHAFEARLEHVINIRFGLPAKVPPAVRAQIKAADRASAFLEATQLAGFGREEARTLFGPPPRGHAQPLAPWPAPQAETRYLERYNDLIRATGS